MTQIARQGFALIAALLFTAVTMHAALYVPKGAATQHVAVAPALA